jgi:hypothetical protein
MAKQRTSKKSAVSYRRVKKQARALTLPILPLAIGAAVSAALIALGILYYRSLPAQPPAPPPQGLPVASIHCDSGEQTATHYHAHLDILYQGQPIPVPAGVGITSSCFYWLHTHDTSGIIHIEAPKDQVNTKFTLGQLFQIWGQPLNSHQVATIPVSKGQQVKAWVDGKPFRGDPSKIVFASHERIVLEIGPAFQDPPPEYNWQPTDPPS